MHNRELLMLYRATIAKTKLTNKKCFKCVWRQKNRYICLCAFNSYPSLSTDPYIGSNLGSLTTYGKEQCHKYKDLEKKSAYNLTEPDNLYVKNKNCSALRGSWEVNISSALFCDRLIIIYVSTTDIYYLIKQNEHGLVR